MAQVIVDRNICQGHGRCYAAAPHLIGVDDQGYAVVPDEGLRVDDTALAQKIEDGCPEMAVTLVDQ
jgi:ferredoxin